MARRGAGRKRRGGHGEKENEDRWLLTYADMITLLMALFMVLFSISSVNTSKFESLQKALEDAFSGKVLPGGKALAQEGATEQAQRPSPQLPLQAMITSIGSPSKQASRTDAHNEDEDFRALKAKLDRYARQHGLAKQVSTTIAQRGLVIRLLTDRVLFDSGAADLKRESGPLLSQIARLLKIDAMHPITVEGHTDPLPIKSMRFPSNWELSTARASSVVRSLIERGLLPRRLTAAGYAALHPIASNSTAEGRSRNRRVEIVLIRLRQGAQGGAP
jgi:chemotaxis protein MotB